MEPIRSGTYDADVALPDDLPPNEGRSVPRSADELAVDPKSKTAGRRDRSVPWDNTDQLERLAKQIRDATPRVDGQWLAPLAGAGFTGLGHQLRAHRLAMEPGALGVRAPLCDVRHFTAVLRPASEVTRLAEQLRASLSPTVEALNESVVRAFEPRRQLLEGASQATQQVVRTYRQSLPPNWRGLDGDGLERTITLGETRGLCVVWAPRREIVEEIIAAENHDARCEVLVRRRKEVLDDILNVLVEATHSVTEAHTQSRRLAIKAVAAAHDGHDEASQALAAAALGLLLHEVLGFERLGTAYKQLSARDIDETAMRLLRLAVIELATAKALRNTDKHDVGFNRHGTLHGYPHFFSGVNCIASLLLLGAWLRELSWWQEHHPDAIEKR